MQHVIERFGADHILGSVKPFGLSVSSASIQRPMFFTDLIDSPTDEWITTFMQDFVRLTAVGSVCFIRLLTAHSGIDRSTALRMSPVYIVQ